MKPHRVSFQLHLVDLAVSGFWFCIRSRSVTEVITAGAQSTCKFCGSKAKWCPPVFDTRQGELKLV